MTRTILITGGAGFIGSHVTKLFVNKYPNYQIIVLDKLTYAGSLDNLKDVETAPNYIFKQGNIESRAAIKAIFLQHEVDAIIHLAAESHVDRSLHNPMQFVETNVNGTVNMLMCARDAWRDDFKGKLFLHVSTDEVYGEAAPGTSFTEDSQINPRSPYSASKAASDHFVSAFHNSYGLPTIITRCSNNYGPKQYPEKLIPVVIDSIIENKPIPVYGKGVNVRDWLYVEDHARAIDMLFHKGLPGEIYNIGGDNEWKNIDLILKLCRIMDKKLNRKPGESAALIKFVNDRPGHDRRYAINPTKVRFATDWEPETSFEDGLGKTVDWYLNRKLIKA